ncbi:hypothetical protein ACQCX2_01610 [Propionibacteriaceae bacterium Y1700]|uniref:hypothetical protein n=1 Tax=Microlunatus sp. Y1700 TaxID=3418487 RepID=UPI003DA75D83
MTTPATPAATTVQNEHLQLTHRPDRGGTITSLRRTSDGLELLWQAPWGELPIGAARPPATASTTATEHWSGGWRTLFPNSGRNVTLYGADLGTDGEAYLAPYDCTPGEDGTSVTLTTRLVRMPIRLTRTLALDGPTLRVTETVRNESGQDVEVMWAQELCFGPPLVSPTTTLTTGASIVRPDPDTTHSVGYDDVMPWPRTQGNSGVINLRKSVAADAKETRKAYLSDFTEHTATLRNPEFDLAVQLTWDGEQMPFCWYELEAGGQDDFPHFLNSYYLALSPSTSWPRQGVHDARRVSSTSVWVTAGQELSTWVELSLV